MKILTKEEEAAHYRAVLQGGTFGTVIGLVGGWAGVMAASRRFHTIRNLTLPMKAFLVTSSGTFVGIIAADHSSRQYEAERNVGLKYLGEREERLRREELAQMSLGNRIGAWAREEKYKIIGATWIASIVGSFVLVGRNPYLTGQQKIVQARVYAQGLTLAVMCASAAFEIHDQRKGQGLLDTAKKGREAVKEAKNQPAELHHQRRDENTDLWQDMVAAEEQKLKSRHQPLYEHEEKKGAVTEAVKAKKEEKAPKEAPKEEAKEEKEEKEDEKEEPEEKDEKKESK
ncbi:uncharacterized protein BHQ10_006447 [Talaromyces amestolkiae]|uniref:HIG1 domain-containing protein n=1 Tax=Talaromyces amestolkiae TaxID=1196081 RepID=A0A364L3P1_TALAM|nr:uncharacterized protein BHQ10_006447 [Talaromyces amestolkiae]RAO70435.1 hypothetical protein BHQ10_006447 [Talaromyces amestolkiae]